MFLALPRLSLALVVLFAGAAGAEADGTHVLRKGAFGCKTVERREAIKDQVRSANPVAAYLAYRRAGNAGDCRQFLRGDEVFLVSRRASDAICVRVSGSSDCFWIHEALLARKR